MKPLALVVGGGIGGLAVALALARRGVHVRLFEQSPEMGEIGAGVQLGPNAFAAFDELGVGERARAVYTDRLLLNDAIDGSTVAELPLDAAFREQFGNPYAVMHRADVYLSLLEGVRGHDCGTFENATRIEGVEASSMRRSCGADLTATLSIIRCVLASNTTWSSPFTAGSWKRGA